MVTRSNGLRMVLAGAATALALTSPLAAESVGFIVQDAATGVRTSPPLPPLGTFPVQLVHDDDTVESTFGVTVGVGAKQFLWFERFTPGTALNLEEIWVLFPATGVPAGGAIDLAVYQDTDGNPANGATLLTSFSATVQAIDGNTFSVYSLPAPQFFDGAGDLLLGVVPRFISSGVTPVNAPATIDTTASLGRAWVGIWTADPPSPPTLSPPPDQLISLLDTLVPASAGNWMIRGFGTPVGTLEVPTLDTLGMVLLTLVLGAAAFVLLRRRGRIAAGLLLALVATAPASAVTIDTFTTNQATLSAPPDASSSVTGGADIIGTRRGMVARNLIGAGPTTAAVAGGNLTLTVTNTTPDSRGRVLVSWDGDTNALVLSPTGLSNANLTTGNATGFRLNFASTTVLAEVEITVYDDAGNFSRAARRVPVSGSPQDVLIPFTEFRVAAGTGAVFSSVGAIEMVLRAGEGTVTLNEVTTTAATIAATKVDTQITDVDGDTRVDPGDRVRYTVTITNTGNQALNVDLSDTVDSNTTLVTGSVSSTPLAHNDQYGWFGNVNFSTDGAARPHLLANDVDPDGDTVTVQAGTFPATSAQGGTLTLVNAATGAFSYNPPAGFSGVDSFNYTILDDNSNTSTATAHISLEGVVWFVDDSNTTPPHLGTQADPFQVLASVNSGSDPDQPGDFIFVYNDDGTPYAGGLVLEADQTLVGEEVGLILGGTLIVPAGGTPDITNAAGVGLTLATNNFASGVTVTGTSGAGIFGNNFGTFVATSLDVTGAGGAALDLSTGTIGGTYGTLSSAGTAAQKGINLVTIAGSLNASTTSLTNPTTDGIFVSGSGTGVFSFGATTITDNAIGAGPTGDGIDVATGNAGATFNFSSLSITADNGTGLRANASGTINISGTGNSVVSTGGSALDIVSTSVGSGATFAALSSTNSVGDGVNLDTVAGALTANGGTIANPSGIGFDLNAGSSNVTYAGSLTNTANALLIDVTARTGGTTTFSGALSSSSAGNGINVSSNTGGTVNFTGGSKILNTGADTAVNLATNTGATINFTGGGLDIDTTSGSGFNATGGAAAITVQGGGNTITSTTGTALNVANTTIGASDLTFQAISSNGGTNGIVLNNTGASGGLTVTGTGSPGSGGTIQNKTGDGVFLSNARDVSLTSMVIDNTDGNGIFGDDLTNFALINSTVSNNGDTSGGSEGSLRFNELLGTCLISGSTIFGSIADNIRMTPASGTLDSLTISGSTIGPTTSGNGLGIDSTGTSVMTVIVNGSSVFQNNFASGILTTVNGASLNLTVSSTTFRDNNIGFDFGNGISSDVTATVTNSTFLRHAGSAINLVSDAGSTNAAQYRATISGNQIGDTNPDSGSMNAFGIAGDFRGDVDAVVSITNNTIRHTDIEGIFVQSRLDNDADAEIGLLDLTLRDNSVTDIDDNSAFPFVTVYGVRVEARNTTNLCLDIAGNNSVGLGGFEHFRTRQRDTSTFRVERLALGAQNAATMQTFVAAQNDAGSTASATVATSFTGVADGTCRTP